MDHFDPLASEMELVCTGLLWAYFGPALLYFGSVLLSNTIVKGASLTLKIELPASFWMLTFGAQTGIITYFLFRGGLGEEIGLRGFALNRLQERYTPLRASMIIGFWWGLWHLPAWLGRSILEILITWLAVFAFSVIFTFFYYETLSLPIVMLLHAAVNSFDDVYETIFPNLINQNWELYYILGILMTGIATAFVLNSRKKPYLGIKGGLS